MIIYVFSVFSVFMYCEDKMMSSCNSGYMNCIIYFPALQWNIERKRKYIRYGYVGKITNISYEFFMNFLWIFYEFLGEVLTKDVAGINEIMAESSSCTFTKSTLSKTWYK